MEIMSYTKLRNNLATAIESVNLNNTPILITRQNHEPAVLISLKDYESYIETEYLLASPINAKRLNNGIKAIKEGRTKKYDLIKL